MKNLYFLCIVILIMVQCNSYKVAEKNIINGNFDAALIEMLDKKAKGVKDKKYTQWVSIVQRSYDKANAEDFSTLEKLMLQNESVAKYQNLYNTYLKLENRQKRIQGLLPIVHNGKNVQITMYNYAPKIQQYKTQYVEALAEDARKKLLTNHTQQARLAYQNYLEIENIMPEYANLYQLKENAYQKGVNTILVQLNNYAPVMIPYRLENALTDYSYFTKDRFWYQFYTEKKENQQFDYTVELNFLAIYVSPERIDRNQFHKEKVIKEGWEYAQNERGEFLRDSLGEKIKIDTYKTVHAEISELYQFKESSIQAEVVVRNKQKILERFPVNSQFVFEDFSSRVRGDERALDEHYRDTYKPNPIPMPSNEQMVYDCGIDLKNKLQYFMDRYF